MEERLRLKVSREKERMCRYFYRKRGHIMNKKKILLVDDDRELCDEMAEMLRYEGYFVDNTTDPLEGKSLIDKNRYDIIILDYKMPAVTGFELIKQIKENVPKTAIFLISGRPHIVELVEREGLSKAITGIISKPFNDQLLLEQLKQNVC
jgi:DNA-binding response OmpR family regulator